MRFAKLLAVVMTIGIILSLAPSSVLAARNGWQGDNSNGWRYYTSDKSYVTSSWKQIDGKWYYFNASGYMESNCYRDGCWLTSSGAWDTRFNHGTWKKNDKGWWYQDNNWYPVSTWLWIDGCRYYFDSKGYMESNCYRDGCWLTATGAWDTRYSHGTWKENSQGKWYQDDGYYPKNCTLRIDGVEYKFNAAGYVVKGSPTAKPTVKPTVKPTPRPTAKPTSRPTNKPTATPSKKPTVIPTKRSTATPTRKPTTAPTKKPTATPTRKPTATPTKKTTATPTKKPVSTPTETPTPKPTYHFNTAKEKEVLRMINKLRKETAVEFEFSYYVPLEITEELTEAAHIRCKELTNNFSHETTSDNSAWAENIYWASWCCDAETIYNKWYNSQGHHNNMIYCCCASNSRKMYCGIGVLEYDGQTFAVFLSKGIEPGDGAPASGYVAPPVTPTPTTKPTSTPTPKSKSSITPTPKPKSK